MHFVDLLGLLDLEKRTYGLGIHAPISKSMDILEIDRESVVLMTDGTHLHVTVAKGIGPSVSGPNVATAESSRIFTDKEILSLL